MAQEAARPTAAPAGDADTAVPRDYTRRSMAVMKELKMNYKYVEMPGEDHGTIVAKSMP